MRLAALIPLLALLSLCHDAGSKRARTEDSATAAGDGASADGKSAKRARTEGGGSAAGGGESKSGAARPQSVVAALDAVSTAMAQLRSSTGGGGKQKQTEQQRMQTLSTLRAFVAQSKAHGAWLLRQGDARDSSEPGEAAAWQRVGWAAAETIAAAAVSLRALSVLSLFLLLSLDRRLRSRSMQTL